LSDNQTTNPFHCQFSPFIIKIRINDRVQNFKHQFQTMTVLTEVVVRSLDEMVDRGGAVNLKEDTHFTALLL
jgi:hypothetical protein